MSNDYLYYLLTFLPILQNPSSILLLYSVRMMTSFTDVNIVGIHPIPCPVPNIRYVVLCVKYFMVCSKFVYVQIKTKIMNHIKNQRPLHTSSIEIHISYSIYQNTPHYIRIGSNLLFVISFWAFKISTISFIHFIYCEFSLKCEYFIQSCRK